MTSTLEERTLYIGIDESNHGRDNEVHAAVFSYDRRDISESFFVKPKSSLKRRQAFGKVQERGLDYSFILIPKSMREKFQDYGLKGAIVASVLQNIDIKDIQNIQIYLDGDWKQKELEDAKKYSAVVLGIDPSRINLKARRRADMTTRIVHYAQCVATYLYRENSVQDLDKDKHRRQIYFPESYFSFCHKKPRKPTEQHHNIRPLNNQRILH